MEIGRSEGDGRSELEKGKSRILLQNVPRLNDPRQNDPRQKVPAAKCPQSKMFQRTRLPKLHNVLAIKRPKSKMFQLQNIQASKK